MTDQSAGAYPDFYPVKGTYADLLCWHLEYWGTKSTGNTSIRGRPWREGEFEAAVYEKNPVSDLSASPKNWRGSGSAPGPRLGKIVADKLFAGKPVFAEWARELEEARVNCQSPEKNRRTVEFPQPPPITSPSLSVPRPTAHFIGRDTECDELAKLLVSGEALAILVQGGPGIGKTELTKAIAHYPDVAAHFGERRFFASLDIATSATAMQDSIVRAIGCDPQHGFQAALDTLRDKHTLLILDNLETPWGAEQQATQDALNELSATPGIVVLASIRGKPFVDGLRWHPHRLNELSKNAAIGLFKSIAGEWVGADPHLDVFMSALGGLPLAINLVARRAHGRASLAPLWREWTEIGAELAVRPHLAPDRLTSLSYSIELSLRSLRSPNVDCLALPLFCFLGALPNGMSLIDAPRILGGAAFDACEVLCHTGLAIERFDRLYLLPPIREFAIRNYPCDHKDSLVWNNHYLGLSKLEPSANIAAVTSMIAAVSREIVNIEAAYQSALMRRDRRFCMKYFGDFLVALRSGLVFSEVCLDLAAAAKQDGDYFDEGLSLFGAALSARSRIKLDEADNLFNSASYCFVMAGRYDWYDAVLEFRWMVGPLPALPRI